MIEFVDTIGNLDDFDPSAIDEIQDPVTSSDDIEEQYQDVSNSGICMSDTIIPDDFQITEESLDFSNSIADTTDDEHEPTYHQSHSKSSVISFTGNGRCRVCSCGGWAGFGDTCENCGHFYNKHI